MTACPRCKAKFSAQPGAEHRWLARHFASAHGAGRVRQFGAPTESGTADNVTRPAA